MCLLCFLGKWFHIIISMLTNQFIYELARSGMQLVPVPCCIELMGPGNDVHRRKSVYRCALHNNGATTDVTSIFFANIFG